ncbi:uncharacterized protein LOC120339805 [Styela clava]
MDSLNTPNSNSRKLSNHSAMDKLKKKRKKKKKTKEGKRSSASSASASGSPDSSGMLKTQASYSSPSILEQSNTYSDKHENCIKVNECLRWPAHSLYQDNAFRSEIVGKFPVPGTTDEEEQERIEIYKMNRRKRYIAAQQALIDKYPDVAVYASSSGSNSSQDINKEERLHSGSNSIISPAVPSTYRSTNASPDSKSLDKEINPRYFSNTEVPLVLSKANGVVVSAPKREVLSV